jgi:hypothetical protein
MTEESITLIKEFLNKNNLLTTLLIEDVNEIVLIKELHKYVNNYNYLSDREIQLIEFLNFKEIYDIDDDYLIEIFKKKFYLYKGINKFNKNKKSNLLNDLEILIKTDIELNDFELKKKKKKFH